MGGGTRRDIPLGRIAGIRVGMSWSVPLVAALYIAVLAGGQLPAEAPGQARSAYWVAGLVGALLFMASLLVHEVGHALVARHHGIGVLGISLWLLGGVAHLEHDAEDATAELKIAGVGPVASAGTGVLFLLLHQTLDGQLGAAQLYAELFRWLGLVNLLLAAFNLLPGSPLDGGRVLSALLWKISGDQTEAQRAAATVGQVLGVGLLVVGALVTFVDGQGGALWMVLVGAFILGAASRERRAAPELGALRSITVGQVMDPDPPVVPDWLTVHDLVAGARRLRGHDAVVVQGPDGRISGVLTAGAVRATDPAAWSQLRLSDVAFPVERVVTARVDAPVSGAVQRAAHAACDRVLVVHPDGRLAGLAGPQAADRALQLQQPRSWEDWSRPSPPIPWTAGSRSGSR